MSTNQNVQKPGVGVWMYAIICAAAAIGSVVISVTTILRAEYFSCVIFLAFCAPIFGFVSWQFGWKPIRAYKKAK